MTEKPRGRIRDRCPHCGEPVRNPLINYCLKCTGVLWSRPIRELLSEIRAIPTKEGN